MIVVDVRGLSCPEPLMMTRDALKGGTPIKVLVSDPHQKTNIEKAMKELGKKVITTKIDRTFEIIIE
jgi:TusA-related sulfurtransferase